ncbi:MAG TPA: chloride channel protein [Phycisphaerae bacterium]|nr:chloride channel protein [Phycisphaerae bacterium]
MPRTLRRFALKGQRLRVRLIELLARIGFKDDYFLIVTSIVIGGATGLGAHLFYSLIEFAREKCYGHTGSGGLFGGRGFMLVVLPAVGALLVGLIVHYFTREAKGHGVPEVMDAIYRHGGVIRPRVALAKAVASALTIGSGGSAGTEGPIIQIGAAIGSTFGQVLQVTRRQMGVLVACGVAGGIAAIFNAPIAGVLFALEIFLKDFSFRTFSPVVFASVLSCSVTHAMRPSDEGIFEVATLERYQYVFDGSELPFYLVLGMVCAVVSVVFIRSLYFTEDICDRLKMPPQAKPALGAVLLGLVGVGYCALSREYVAPPFFGNGYPVIAHVIGEGLFGLSTSLLLVVCGLKILATCFTLGFGGSGGIFAPSLLMGAAVGGAFGLGLQWLGWVDPSSVTAYALVGMGALVAGTTHAPLTAIVILYELTRQPLVILPVMFAAIVSTAGAQVLFRDSIYTLKLRRRGVRMGTLADLTILKRITVDDVEHQPAPIVRLHDPLQKVLEMAAETDAADFVVVDEEGAYQGLVVADDIKTALLQPEAVPLLLVEELLRSGVPTVNRKEALDSVLDKLARTHVPALAISSDRDSSRVEGLITRQAVIDRYQKELEKQAG